LTTFGRYLLDRAVLARVQLEEATQVLVIFGGRLGTILVESGLLTMEQVEAHLSAHLGLPSAPLEHLRRPDPEVLRQVGRDVARRHKLFPMWIAKRRLHAAMLDPANPESIDAASFAVGLAVSPYVIGERRLVDLLWEHYGIRPDSRFTDSNLLELAGHVRSPRAAGGDRWQWGGAAPARVDRAGESEEIERWRDAHGIHPLAEGEELSDESVFGSLHAGPSGGSTGAGAAARGSGTRGQSAGASPPRLEPARSAAELRALEAELATIGDRDAVAPTALRIAACHARAAALFSVRSGIIQGVLAARGSTNEPIEGLCVPASEPSMLAVAARGEVFHGRPGREGLDAVVARRVGGGDPREVAIVPVVVRGRVVQLLYVDNGPDPLPRSSLAALGTLCDGVSAAFDRLIEETTRRHC
jgi:hypothetical protein